MKTCFWKSEKIINPYLRGEVGRVVGQIGKYHSFLVIVFTQYFVVAQKETVSYTKSENVKIIFLWNEAKLVNTKHQNIILWHSTFWQNIAKKFKNNKQSPNFFKDVSFHVSFHVKFGNMRCCDFSINNPQNSCLVTWLLTWNITFCVQVGL